MKLALVQKFFGDGCIIGCHLHLIEYCAFGIHFVKKSAAQRVRRVIRKKSYLLFEPLWMGIVVGVMNSNEFTARIFKALICRPYLTNIFFQGKNFNPFIAKSFDNGD